MLQLLSDTAQEYEMMGFGEATQARFDRKILDQIRERVILGRQIADQNRELVLLELQVADQNWKIQNLLDQINHQRIQFEENAKLEAENSVAQMLSDRENLIQRVKALEGGLKQKSDAPVLSYQSASRERNVRDRQITFKTEHIS